MSPRDRLRVGAALRKHFCSSAPAVRGRPGKKNKAIAASRAAHVSVAVGRGAPQGRAPGTFGGPWARTLVRHQRALAPKRSGHLLARLRLLAGRAPRHGRAALVAWPLGRALRGKPRGVGLCRRRSFSSARHLRMRSPGMGARPRLVRDASPVRGRRVPSPLPRQRPHGSHNARVALSQDACALCAAVRSVLFFSTETMTCLSPLLEVRPRTGFASLHSLTVWHHSCWCRCVRS